jgi:DNA-binding CsgD family transcriptional regulator
VVEAAYTLDGDERGWLERVALAAEPVLGLGLGVFAYRYDFSDPDRPSLEPTIAHAMPDDFLSAARTEHLRMPFEQRIAMYRAGPCFTTSRVFANTQRYVVSSSMRERFGAADYLGIVAANPGDIGCALVVPSPDPLSLDTHVTRRWSRVAAHVAAAVRMRAAFAEESIEAVFHPSGALADASGDAAQSDAREALRRAVIGVDTARSQRGRSDPDDALTLWRGLVAGRWSLVDRFDRDGRRFLLAVKNPPSDRARPGLTPLELAVVEYLAFGHSQKLIAYELGLSAPRVNQLATSACKKLGLKSRLDIARFGLSTARERAEA